MSRFYLTTTLPYVNSAPHIGFGMELVAADVICRTHALLGDQVIFNTGTDEHGQKIFDAAQAAGQEVHQYVDRNAQSFHDLIDLLNISTTHFIRTSQPSHYLAAQEFWRRCDQNGDIYKANYQSLYCVGCELEKQLSDLVDGHCPLHPGLDIQKRDEENYFFRFSKYQQPLLDLYQRQSPFVLPEEKQTEITAFVQSGLKDFSISRLKSKLAWGIPVPGDDAHVMYVWFDALINYISTLGWPEEKTEFDQFWPGVQIAGKDNLRQQSAMWQAMLLSAGLAPSRQILINGFISIGGQKMSKSLGNVISPDQLVERYGQDGARFLLIAIGPVAGDIDISWDKLNLIYQNYLAHGLGNLVSRLAKLAQIAQLTGPQITASPLTTTRDKLLSLITQYRFTDWLQLVDQSIRAIDLELTLTKPWQLTGQDQSEKVLALVVQLLDLVSGLQPVMPTTCQNIGLHLSADHIADIKPLFEGLKL